jgi:hypothetical protein
LQQRDPHMLISKWWIGLTKKASSTRTTTHVLLDTQNSNTWTVADEIAIQSQNYICMNDIQKFELNLIQSREVGHNYEINGVSSWRMGEHYGIDAFIKLVELEHHNKQRSKNKTSSTECLQS